LNPKNREWLLAPLNQFYGNESRIASFSFFSITEKKYKAVISAVVDPGAGGDENCQFCVTFF